jgi:hypothetical protein
MQRSPELSIAYSSAAELNDADEGQNTHQEGNDRTILSAKKNNLLFPPELTPFSCSSTIIFFLHFPFGCSYY